MSKKKRKKKQRPTDATAAKAINAKKRKRKRRGRYTLHYILIAIFVLAAGVALSLTVFFKIEAVDVKGNTMYLEEQIVDATQIKVGDNMFKVKRNEIEASLKKRFIYIKEVQLEYRLPPKILIDIKEETPMSVARVDASRHAIISDTGKILQIIDGQPQSEAPLVIGLDLLNLNEGDYIVEAVNSEKLSMLASLVTAIEKTGFIGATRLDISDRLNIRIVYEGKILIELGTEGDLEYKLRFADYALKNSIENNFEGVIDASIAKEVRIRAIDLDENFKPIKNEEPILPAPEDDSEILQAVEGVVGSQPSAPLESSSVPSAIKPNSDIKSG